MRQTLWAVATALSLGPVGTFGAAAQGVAAEAVAALPPGDADKGTPGDAPPAGPSGPNFAVVPGPFFNPNQGLGVMVIPMLMFRASATDDVSPPSLATLAGMYSVLPPLGDAGTRYSWGLVAATRLFLDEDRWRIVLAAGYFDLYREFHGIGGNPTANALFDFRQAGAIAFAQVLREVGVRHLYAGVILGYTAFRAKASDPVGQAVLDSLGAGNEWSGQLNLGIAAQYDTRNDQYFASSGLDFGFRMNGSLKNDQQYLVVVPTFAQYFPLGEGRRVVIAYMVLGQFGFGALPLASYANYGSRGTIPGYPAGEFMDKMMLGAQAEVRWLFWWRLGLEGGLGAGKVFPTFGEFWSQPWLPSGWGSLTYKVMEDQEIRVRLTVAVGKSGALLYFALGQNF